MTKSPALIALSRLVIENTEEAQRDAMRVLGYELGFRGETDYEDVDRAAHELCRERLPSDLPALMTAIGVLS